MLTTLLRPGWIITHVIVVAIAATFISLGIWQINRDAEQTRENARITQQVNQAPSPVEDLLALQDIDLLPATARGEFLGDLGVTLSPRSRNQRPGFEILTPLRLEDGSALLVNRGWVPLDDPAPAPRSGTVDVTGRLRSPASSRQVLSDDAGTVTLLSNVDLDVLDAQIGDLITHAYLEVVDESARDAGTIPRPAEPVVLEDGPHLGYAAQWFAFTAIGLIGYPLLLRRRLRERSGPGDDGGRDGTSATVPADGTDPPTGLAEPAGATK